MHFDYKNHDECIEALKAKDDINTKLAIKSYHNMNIACMIGIAMFILFAVSYFIINKITGEVKDIFCIINVITITLPMIVGVFLGQEYREYIRNNDIVILEDILYYYSK